MPKNKLFTKAIPLPDGTRKYVRAKTKEELDEKVTKLKLELHAGVNIKAGTTFAELAQLWFDTYKRPRLRPSSVKTLRDTLNLRILPYIGGMPIRDIKPVHVQKVMLAAADRSHSTQSKVLNAMRGVFDMAVENNLILRSPMTPNIKAYGAKADEVEPLTKEQSARLLDAVKGLRVEPAVALMLGTGLRRAEACGLMWSDIDFTRHTLTVRRSNVFSAGVKSLLSTDLKSAAAYRTLPLPVWVEDILLETKAHSNSLYVLSLINGDALTEGAFRSMWNTIKARTADCSSELGTAKPKHPGVIRSLDFHVHPHLLRHTCITRWVETGRYDLKEIQYLAGHASPEITLRVYAHYDLAGRFEETLAKMRAIN